jgi:hypothetical protein
MLNKKVLTFGLAGAVGCLLGWAFGEGLLLAGLPDESEGSATPSLVTPEPPTATAPKVDVPAVPDLPDAPKEKVAAPPPPEFQKRLIREKAQQFGDVRITLIWNNYNDLDLHCLEPGGEQISFSHKKSASGGELDVDKNVIPTTESPVENIYWPRDGAPSGTYRVYVNHFKHHSGRAASRTPYKINLMVDGEQQAFDGEITHSQPMRLIHTFTFSSTIRLAAPSQMEVNQNGSNHMKIRIQRKRYNGPVTVRAEDVDGISMPPVTLDAGENEADLEITADDDATGGEHILTLVATGGAEAEVIIDVKVPTPVLALTVPERVDLRQGGTNRFKVRIASLGLEGPIKVRAKESLQGITIGEVTLDPDQTEAEIEVQATEETTAGDLSLELIASVGDGTQADSALKLRILEAITPSSAWSWWMILLMGLWTALLTIGMALALVVTQNRYLRRPLLDRSQLFMVLGGGALVGLLSGGTGQILLMLLALADFLPTVGFVIGWALLGALVGGGLAYFIPNLHRWKASAAGAGGGLAGSLVFVLVTNFAGDVAGRLLGAVLLGLSIGLMVALVELAFRQAWLEVRYGASELITVNLGPEPVKIGSDGHACAIYARNAAPVAFRYWLAQGKVFCENMESNVVDEAATDQVQQIGAIGVTVRTGAGDLSSTRQTTAGCGAGKPAKPAPPPPMPAGAASKSKQTRPTPKSSSKPAGQSSRKVSANPTLNTAPPPPPPPPRKPG